eukprot:g2033.t1
MECNKSVYFVRHGQSQSNVLFYAGHVQEARAIRDPALTEEGERQARAVPTEYERVLGGALALEGPERADVLVISPLRRTIQTAMLAFGDWIKRREEAGSPVRVVLSPDIQETGDVLCDCGRPASELVPEFAAAYPCLPLDSLEENWCEKVGPYAHTGPALAGRFRSFTTWAQQQPEKNMIVVAHHNVFLGMFGLTFLNCETRKFALDCAAGKDGGGDAWPQPPPLTPPWLPTDPPKSTTDEELSDAERAFLENPTMLKHNCDKMATWGFRMPERWR